MLSAGLAPAYIVNTLIKWQNQAHTKIDRISNKRSESVDALKAMIADLLLELQHMNIGV